jgi:uncharacterized membrane protein YsdA (DUF1294 family)/cold shock CspA family protein
MQLYEGIIKSWEVDEGVGLIQPSGGGKDIVIQFSDLKNSHYQPKQGDTICFKVIAEEDGKIKAYDAFIYAPEKSQLQPRNKPVIKKKLHKSKPKGNQFWAFCKYFIASLPFIFSVDLIIQKMIILPFFVYAIMSLLTFFVYAIDETKAHKRKWRTPDNIFHWLAFLGGWPGALITQHVIRHKNRERSFQLILWLIVIVHLFVWMDIVFNGSGILSLLAIFI